MMKLRGTTPNAIHFTLLAPTAVIASIGPGSIVSNDSYNNLPMIHIVRTKVLIHPEFVQYQIWLQIRQLIINQVLCVQY